MQTAPGKGSPAAPGRLEERLRCSRERAKNAMSHFLIFSRCNAERFRREIRTADSLVSMCRALKNRRMRPASTLCVASRAAQSRQSTTAVPLGFRMLQPAASPPGGEGSLGRHRCQQPRHALASGWVGPPSCQHARDRRPHRASVWPRDPWRASPSRSSRLPCRSAGRPHATRKLMQAARGNSRQASRRRSPARDRSTGCVIVIVGAAGVAAEGQASVSRVAACGREGAAQTWTLWQRPTDALCGCHHPAALLGPLSVQDTMN